MDGIKYIEEIASLKVKLDLIEQNFEKDIKEIKDEQKTLEREMNNKIKDIDQKLDKHLSLILDKIESINTAISKSKGGIEVFKFIFNLLLGSGLLTALFLFFMSKH